MPDPGRLILHTGRRDTYRIGIAWDSKVFIGSSSYTHVHTMSVGLRARCAPLQNYYAKLQNELETSRYTSPRQSAETLSRALSTQTHLLFLVWAEVSEEKMHRQLTAFQLS